ncbi:hypothetical protein JTE88_05060 [Arcanobacterium phocisimile]|uniref:Uncharacterized protein n=1 Tax=Arcanobacterium phocisimile TaxID=1302235 RepID=A0ABX7IFF9_9ACTO|nr:hypothetical protein [Arcanobacterium phocisimile]QRV01485.1 hypothetical protein JTE88_05060 [Arcanobacterium phocisimile]
MGSYVMPGITVLFFALILGGIGYVLFGSRHQGAWDDEAKVSAKMKQRGWKVKPKIDEVTSYLLGSDTSGEMWPVPAGETGVQGVGKDSWRAVTVQRASGDVLIVSIALAQRSDGSIAHVPEALVQHQDENFDVRTVIGTTPQYFTPEVRATITSWSELEFLYFYGEHLTAGVSTEHGRSDIIEYLEQTLERLRSVGRVLPSQLWS